MKRVHFFIYDELAEQINTAINRWGFNSQSEFFRYLAMEFIRNEKKMVATDDTLKEHTSAIRQIKNSQRRSYLNPQK